MNSGLAIIVSSGTLKGVYGQGVLSALEERCVAPAAWGCASSSVVSACFAAVGKSRELGLEYWTHTAKRSQEQGMSSVVKISIQEYSEMFKESLFTRGAPRILIATSYVNNSNACEITQTSKAKVQGKRLLLDLYRGNTEWVDQNLTKTIFDTAGEGKTKLTRENFDEVVYASTRMLHAWDEPAEIGGEPYVDASYTCSCPAYEVADLGYKRILVVDVETGTTYTSLGRKRVVEAGKEGNFEVLIVRPDLDLKSIGVDYLKASEEGNHSGLQERV
jgi:predicted acylesterase/phospholipase RssA